MPFDISTLSATPNPIPIPGGTELSFSITGTPGTKVKIEYSLSLSNNIVFLNGSKTKSGGTQLITTSGINIIDNLDFKSLGINQMVSFFITTKVTNIVNGAVKLQKIQIRVS